MNYRLAPLLLWLCSSSLVMADVRVPSLFTDYMILQQETSNAVWGFAAPGEKVTVTASWGTEERTVANKDGDWKTKVTGGINPTNQRVTASGIRSNLNDSHVLLTGRRDWVINGPILPSRLASHSSVVNSDRYST